METKAINKKLLAAQKKIGAISKDSTNPFFKSKYFDINGLLAVVKPVLNENGLILLQPLDGDKLKTILIDADSGEEISSVVNLTLNTDPQKMGSVITYFRRYSLQALLAIEAEDDDANSASNGHQEPQRKNPPVKPVSGKDIASGLNNAASGKATKQQIEVLKALYAQANITPDKGTPMLVGLFMKEKTGDLTSAEATQLTCWLKDGMAGKCNVKKDDNGVILRFEYPPESEVE